MCAFFSSFFFTALVNNFSTRNLVLIIKISGGERRGGSDKKYRLVCALSRPFFFIFPVVFIITEKSPLLLYFQFCFIIVVRMNIIVKI